MKQNDGGPSMEHQASPHEIATESKYRHQNPRNDQGFAKSNFSPSRIQASAQARFCAPDFLTLLGVWLGWNRYSWSSRSAESNKISCKWFGTHLPLQISCPSQECKSAQFCTVLDMLLFWHQILQVLVWNFYSLIVPEKYYQIGHQKAHPKLHTWGAFIQQRKGINSLYPRNVIVGCTCCFDLLLWFLRWHPLAKHLIRS